LKIKIFVHPKFIQAGYVYIDTTADFFYFRIRVVSISR